MRAWFMKNRCYELLIRTIQIAIAIVTLKNKSINVNICIFILIEVIAGDWSGLSQFLLICMVIV
ncbi:hypothetical protein SALWKB12_1006 [Snodgrassella communis]|uniref:Uncharacterized protein n=1 Tax=Snodgrassella communis TaxID=2946699 RepID=A0A836MSA3_9NEIS|nr:hypothetical protein SALWKB12_1006 [Snodgrassella communis]KDN15525.1 hypothetical protein SALWKB29_0629 [Snodgrassella communis]